MSRPSSLAVACGLVAAFATFVQAQSPLLLRLEEDVPRAPFLDASRTLADIDGDGDNDLIQSTRALLNDGDGRFVLQPGTFPFGFVGSSSVAAADLNGDGAPDLVGAGIVCLNDGTGLFPPALRTGLPLPPSPCPQVFEYQVAPLLFDTDGDGDRDIVYPTYLLCGPGVLPGPVLLYGNDGAGGFSLASPALGGIATRAAFAAARDFDADGDRDVLLVSGGYATVAANPFPVILWNSGGTFTAASGGIGSGLAASCGALGDWNGDGNIDLALSVSTATGPADEIVFGTSLGFGATVSAPTAYPAKAMFAVDVDADGSAELVRMGTSISIHDVNGAGLVLPAIQDLGFSVYGGVLGDVDSDGDADLVVDSVLGARMLLFDPNVTRFVPLPHGASLATLGIRQFAAELNGDGFADLVSEVQVANWIRFLRPVINDGTGRFEVPPSGIPGYPLPFADPPRTWIPVDVDGDGDDDLLGAATAVMYGSGPPNDVLLLTVPGGWTLSYQAPSPFLAQAGVAGDLDGDGDRDVVVAGYRTDQGPASGLVLRNTGSGGFAVPERLPEAHRTAALALADLDLDGDLDIVQANEGAYEQSRVYLNDGTGSFTVGAALPAASFQQLATGDLDGDGDVDVVIDNYPFLNDGSGGFTPGSGGPLSYNPSQFADLDGDGDLDLVSNAGEIRRNLGGGAFAPVETFEPQPPPAVSYRPAIVADFDRDRDLDVVLSGPRLYLNTTRHLARAKVARIGRTASFEVHGPAGAPFLLGLSLAPAAVPLPPSGTLYLEPSTLALAAAGTLGVDGRGSFAALVPPLISLTGTAFHWQAWVGGGPGLTNRTTTILLAP